MSLAGLPPEVVPEIASVFVDALLVTMKNEGSAGTLTWDTVIAARVAGVATKPPQTSAAASTAPAAALNLGLCTAPPLRRRARILL